MDPTANLKEQRNLVKLIICLGETPSQAGDEAALARYAARLADLVEALDEWIRDGGSIPRQWKGADQCAHCKDRFNATRADKLCICPRCK